MERERLRGSTLVKTAARDSEGPTTAPIFVIGIDVGGTKCAGGILALSEGRVLTRRRQPTGTERGGEAVLADAIRLVQSLKDEASQEGHTPVAVGLGVAELVNADGSIVSAATIPWQGIPVAASIHSATGLRTTIDADVRAAARAEARLGAGRGLSDFVYVTVGTGISSALVIAGSPYAGARGLTGTFASGRSLIPSDTGDLLSGMSLEHFAGGPALAARLAQARHGFSGTGADVVALAEEGDAPARSIVASAGRALGAAVAGLVNTLDPAAVVLGGGLGLAGGLYHQSLQAALREFIWSEQHRDLPLLAASLGPDAGWIGAALAAQP
jgi:glucokinase